MNHVDLRELSVHATSPALTVFVSLQNERRRVDKVNAMYGQARAEFKKKYPQDWEKILVDVHVLLSHVDIEKDCLGVVLFLNKSLARAYPVAFEVQDTIFCGNHFLTRPLAHALNRLQRFWLLLLHNQTPYLFEGYDHTLSEVVHKHMTRTGEESFEVQEAAGKVCTMPTQQWGPQCRYASVQDYIKKIDAYLDHFFSTEDLPLVVVGSRSDLEKFEQYSTFHEKIIANHAIEGVFSTEALLKAVLPAVRRHAAKIVKQELKELAQAHKANLTAQGAEAVFKIVRSDRARLVCVERQLQESACEDLATASAKKGTDCGSLKKIDIIDEVLELCASKGIRVALLDKGVMAEYDGIAAILTD